MTGARVQGADRVKRTLHQLADNLDNLGDTAARGADLVAGSARSYARVATGAMRGSIKINQTAEGAQVTAGEGITGPYPAVQEFGSKRHGISPNRYMAQAMTSTEPAVVRLFEDEVNREVDQVKGV